MQQEIRQTRQSKHILPFRNTVYGVLIQTSSVIQIIEVCLNCNNFFFHFLNNVTTIFLNDGLEFTSNLDYAISLFFFLRNIICISDHLKFCGINQNKFDLVRIYYHYRGNLLNYNKILDLLIIHYEQ